MIILCIILGIIAGFSLAFSIIIHRIKRSNDIGDSTASFLDFSKEPLNMIASKDRM